MTVEAGQVMKIYLAGPLFSEAEQNWLRETKNRMVELAKQLHKEVKVIWPYELIAPEELASLGPKAPFEIFSRCKAELETTDILVALLDGSQVDDGTAWEIGYFCARRSEGSHLIGIRTDFRNAGDTPFSKVNVMIEAACDTIARSSEELYTILCGVLNK